MLFLWNNSEKYTRCRPVTLQIGEVADYDFLQCAEQAFKVLDILDSCKLIDCPYFSPEEVLVVIQDLVDEIDLGSDDFQVNEYRHIRVEFRDELLSVEVFIGV